jgi:hypothetical protein
MSEFAPQPEQTDGDESDARLVIHERVVSGEELTNELYIEYQRAGEAQVDILTGDPVYNRFQWALECAELLAAGGRLDEAGGAMNELANESYDAGYDEISELSGQRFNELTRPTDSTAP